MPASRARRILRRGKDTTGSCRAIIPQLRDLLEYGFGVVVPPPRARAPSEHGEKTSDTSLEPEVQKLSNHLVAGTGKSMRVYGGRGRDGKQFSSQPPYASQLKSWRRLALPNKLLRPGF